MFFEFSDIQRPYLFHQAIDDLYTGQIATMCSAIKALASKGFLMECTVRIAIKKATKLILEFTNPLDGFLTQGPYQILTGQPLAANN